jgi:adenosine deaminase
MIDPQLPLIDLHRHLDGNVRLKTIIELGKAHNLSLPAWEVDELRPHVQVTGQQPGVMAFIAKFTWMLEAMVDYEACRRIAYENVEDAKQEGLDYVELRFSPWFMSQAHELNPVGVVVAVCDGVAAARRDLDIPVNLIGIISRTYGPQVAWLELNALLSERDQIVALDLAGDEANWPGELFNEHFKRARDVGWRITVHAGEIDGPDSVWQAVNELGATRIGHGICILEDPLLADHLRDNRIGIEVSLTSNVQTSTVSNYQSHPMRRFLQHGLLATLNSDDPGISGIDLRYEYEIAAPKAGLGQDQIRQAQQNALEIAFLPEEEKKALKMKKVKNLTL